MCRCYHRNFFEFFSVGSDSEYNLRLPGFSVTESPLLSPSEMNFVWFNLLQLSQATASQEGPHCDGVISEEPIEFLGSS
jgi:hypothetical protein